MPLSFTAAERKSITRRQIRIALENAAFANTQTQLTSQQAQLLQVDNANAVFYNFYKTMVNQYETEVRQINGVISATYSDSDVTASGQFPADTIFFPSGPPAYAFFIPKVINQNKGFFHTTGTDSRYELNILSNADVSQGLVQVIDLLLNGITGASSASTTTTSSIAGGVIVGTVVPVNSTTNFTSGELVYINQGANSGIYRITSIVPATSITIDSVFPSASTISTSATVDNTVVGFTNTERTNLISATYQEILTSLTNKIIALVIEWEGKIDSQITALTAQNDDRATQVAENVIALADVNNTKVIIDAWQALPNTGVTGKFTDAELPSIQNEITARQTFTSTRTTQITTALGSSSGQALTQSGNTYSTSVANNPYYNRYKWLNIRINKQSGSLRRYYAASQGIDFLAMSISDNTAVQGEYDSYFTTKAITFNDATSIVHVQNITGLVATDTITVVSETQPEITRTIVSVAGTTQLELNSPIPNTYITDDIARVFKTL